jgi:hypothetical protein
MTHNKVVIRFRDGRLLKGSVSDFAPNRDLFHFKPALSTPHEKPLEVRFSEIKALFFVRDFKGNPDRVANTASAAAIPVAGRKIRVVFQDGEIMLGTTNGYQPERPGFFVVPADAGSNNERCFVISSATREVSFV